VEERKSSRRGENDQHQEAYAVTSICQPPFLGHRKDRYLKDYKVKKRQKKIKSKGKKERAGPSWERKHLVKKRPLKALKDTKFTDVPPSTPVGTGGCPVTHARGPFTKWSGDSLIISSQS